MEGYVRKMFLEKGFAFIEGEDERDYFLHWSKVSRNSVPFRNIKENDKVTFDFEEGTNGPKALNVLVVRGDQANGRRKTGIHSDSSDIGPSRSEQSGREAGEPSSATGTSDRGPSVDNLSEHSNVLRRDDTTGSGRATDDEAGNRSGAQGGEGTEEGDEGRRDLHQSVQPTDRQDEAR